MIILECGYTGNPAVGMLVAGSALEEGAQSIAVVFDVVTQSAGVIGGNAVGVGSVYEDNMRAQADQINVFLIFGRTGKLDGLHFTVSVVGVLFNVFVDQIAVTVTGGSAVFHVIVTDESHILGNAAADGDGGGRQVSNGVDGSLGNILVYQRAVSVFPIPAGPDDIDAGVVVGTVDQSALSRNAGGFGNRILHGVQEDGGGQNIVQGDQQEGILSFGNGNTDSLKLIQKAGGHTGGVTAGQRNAGLSGH